MGCKECTRLGYFVVTFVDVAYFSVASRERPYALQGSSPLASLVCIISSGMQ